MVHSLSPRQAWPRGQQGGFFAYGLLYLPALLAWGLAASPVLSFGVAWAGSWWILWLSMTGRVRPLPGDRSWENQLFRPLFLAQIMFFGLFCFGSIFYMWDLSASGGGLSKIGAEIQRTAAAQRYYALGHAAFVHGLLVFMDYRRSGEWDLNVRIPMQRLFFYGAIGALGGIVVFASIPGLEQFSGKFEYLFVVASILGFAYALRSGNTPMILLTGVLYGYILVEVFLSGWKHQIILVVGLLLMVLYPTYKRTVGVLAIVFAISFATLLPAYNGVFRQLNWQENMDAEQAAQVAFDRVVNGQMDIGDVSWRFLTNRLTTVSLFTDYIRNVPDRRPYYGFSTVEQAAYSMIPDVFWPGKPNTEKLVMQRVHENTSVRPTSRVSAKPLLVVDGYLAGGWIGIFGACFVLGAFASVASRYAERWFGGYEIGSQLIFTGLFARVLFVASFEFLFNALFWSVVLMMMLSYGLWYAGILQWGGAGTRHPRTAASMSTASP